MNRREDKKEIRLNRYLAQCGLGSRRQCDEFISAGRILVNGKKILVLGMKIDPEKDSVEYKGKKVKEIKKLEYVAYHKSKGTLVTAKDPKKRKTVYDEIKKSSYNADHLKYIGRLDRDSEGLLILTNDGDMIHGLTHPRFHIKKMYQVKIDSELNQKDAEVMVTSGVMSEGERLQAGAVRILPKTDTGGFWYEVDLYEGKNRQIRRIFNALGYDVLRLKRTQFSSIKLRNLPRGKFRPLNEREIKALKNRGYKNKK